MRRTGPKGLIAVALAAVSLLAVGLAGPASAHRTACDVS